ncbi:MAG: C-GCAxxG-C-C family (seleno)protein [Chloroflexota bacterium]
MDTKKTPGQVALDLFNQGYSCSESVWLALSQDLDAAQRDLGLKIAGAFAGGCGSGALCGAVAGGLMAAGRWYGRALGEEKPTQLKPLCKRLTDAVKAKFGSLDCADLKPESDDWRKKCGELVEFVANITDQLLDEGEEEDCG